jgi:4-hydroxybenzoate decarboxylase subunit C
VLVHLLERTQFETDLFVFANVSMDTLDYTGPVVNEGSKGVWLGVGDPVRTLPREFRPACEPPGEAKAPRVFCPGCLVVGAPPAGTDPDAPARFAAHPAFAGWPLIVVTDEPKRAAASTMNFLWTTFTRLEPAADIHAASKRIVRNHVAFTPPVVFDARLKPGFPKELFADEATGRRVDARWREYFPSDVAMGDSAKGHLD